MEHAITLTFAVGTVMAFILESYDGRTSHGNPCKEGVKYALLAIAGAVISHFIADCIQLLI